MEKIISDIVTKTTKADYIEAILKINIPAREKWVMFIDEGLKRQMYNREIVFYPMKNVETTDTSWEAEKKLKIIDYNISLVCGVGADRDILIDYVKNGNGHMIEKAKEKIKEFGYWLDNKLKARSQNDYLFNGEGKFYFSKAERIIKNCYQEDYETYAEIIRERNSKNKKRSHLDS